MHPIELPPGVQAPLDKVYAVGGLVLFLLSMPFGLGAIDRSIGLLGRITNQDYGKSR